MKISQFRLVLVCVLLTVGLGIVGAQDSNYEALTAADVLHADYQDVEIHSADAFAILGLLMGIPELPVDDSLWATYFYSSESLDAEMRQIGLTGFRPHPYSDEATLIYEFQGQMECYTDGDGNPIPGDQFYVDFGASLPTASLSSLEQPRLSTNRSLSRRGGLSERFPPTQVRMLNRMAGVGSSRI